MSSQSRRSGQRGQTVPLMALLLVALGFLAVFVAQVGGRTREQAEARTAADAAALAGVRGGAGAASAMAGANEAQLTSYREEDGAVVVQVRIGHSVASAKAVLTLSDDSP